MKWIVPLLALGIVASSAVLQADDPTSLTIEGYTDQLSYRPGDVVEFHVSTTAGRYALEIARLGAGEPKVIWSKTDLPGASTRSRRTRRRMAAPGLFRMRSRFPQTGKAATTMSGCGRATTAASMSAAIAGPPRSTSSSSFGRPCRARCAPILLQLCTNTYNAYNNWGGGSLYAYHGRANLQGHRVSFSRPMEGQFRQWELAFVAWAERNGYALDYCANSDLEFHPELLEHYKLVLSVGHDEYWSTPMRDHLEAFIKGGGNVAFFSGNTCCWQVRSEENGRALTCWKQGFNQDPVFVTADHRTLSTLWSHHLVKRPENQLTGVGFIHGGYHLSHGQFMDGKGAFRVHRPDHWILEGTSLKAGDDFGAKHTIVGYECDGCEFEMKNGLPVPTGRDGTPENFIIVATCPARWHPDDALWYDHFPRDSAGRPTDGAAVFGLYTQGGTVVTVGTTDWAHGLRGGDEVVERITRNILDRLSR